MRLRLLRHSPLGFGLLLVRPRDADLTRRWLAPATTDGRIGRDSARVARLRVHVGVDRRPGGRRRGHRRHHRGDGDALIGRTTRSPGPMSASRR
jgi:hypothetical protein